MQLPRFGGELPLHSPLFPAVQHGQLRQYFNRSRAKFVQNLFASVWICIRANYYSYEWTRELFARFILKHSTHRTRQHW